MNECDVKEVTDFIPTRRAAARDRRQGLGWTTPLVAGVAACALLMGLMAGTLIGRDRSASALAEARREIQARDASINTLTSRVATLESQLDQRPAAAAGRAAGPVAGPAEDGSTIPGLDRIPDLVGALSRLSRWFSDTLGSFGGSLEATTRFEPLPGEQTTP